MRERAGNFDNVPKLGYSPAEAAYALALGRTKTYELIAQGKLRSIRVGKRVIVPADAIREFLEQAATEGAK